MIIFTLYLRQHGGAPGLDSKIITNYKILKTETTSLNVDVRFSDAMPSLALGDWQNYL